MQQPMLHYLSVVTNGPLIVVRIPWPRGCRWRDMLKALTPIMAAHGCRQKDIVLIESMTYYTPDDSPEKNFWWKESLAAKDAALRARLAAAFAGDPDILPKFWLYDWKDGRFILARSGTCS